MQEYKDKLHAALREIAECPVSMRTVEQAAAVWTMEQTTAVAESMGIQAPAVPRWAWGVTMNMMYSDYYPVAVEFGLNRPEFYAALAKAFLIDKDGPGPERKLMEYYEHIAKRSVQS